MDNLERVGVGVEVGVGMVDIDSGSCVGMGNG
jgi:hypothetical protein